MKIMLIFLLCILGAIFSVIGGILSDMALLPLRMEEGCLALIERLLERRR